MHIHLDNEWFIKIKNGQKTIESRLYDEKRRKIKIGDIIEFENRLDGEIIKCEVVNLYLFKDFKTLYNSIDQKKLGYDKSSKENYKDLLKFYSSLDELKYGVVAIELKNIKNN